MYLFRLPNSVYYTRISTPLSLREMGYPSEFKFSLLTRERKTAYLRNIEQVQLLLGLFQKAISTSLDLLEFKTELTKLIDGLRQCYQQHSDSEIRAPKLATTSSLAKPKKTKSTKGGDLLVINHDTLNQFIESKRLEGITNLSIKQLQQRCGDFLDYLKQQSITKPTNSHAMNYRDELLKRDLSYKTLKDYIAANKQFFNWCIAHELIAINPFAVVKLPTKNNKSAQDQRQRWKLHELKRLFSSEGYRKQSPQFRWITLIMLYQGCRPSEVCQLQVRDIELGELPCIHFTDEADDQKLKNATSKRVVPIHKRLIEMGFLEFVQQRQQAKRKQLFDLTPRGDDNDWSKDFRDIFGDVLDAIGFQAGNRPTAYSLRHTFIDELKQAKVEEHIVAQIVGHKQEGMTFGRYGKMLPMELLVDAVNTFALDSDMENHAFH